MAPSRSKVPKASASDDLHEMPSRQQTVTIQSPARTPNQSPSKMPIGITQAQKQALIDNLQLEITERARKLRAQYALQAQGLRNRIELRINRIPKSLRTANMGELFVKYQEIRNQTSNTNTELSKQPSQKEVVQPIAELPSTQELAQQLKDTATTTSIYTRGTKRKSDDMKICDKENLPDPMQTIPNPKKRTKVIKGTATQKGPVQSTILSPKSSNSRTLPQSPMHPPTGSHQKPFATCPTSPLKPIVIIKSLPAKSLAIASANPVSAMGEKAKPTRAKAATTRKASNLTAKPKTAISRPKHGADVAPTQSRSVSNTSHASNTSTGTTIMKKGAKSITATVAPVSKKKNLNVGTRAAGKKAATATEAPPPGRRILRKRA